MNLKLFFHKVILTVFIFQVFGINSFSQSWMNHSHLDSNTVVDLVNHLKSEGIFRSKEKGVLEFYQAYSETDVLSINVQTLVENDSNINVYFNLFSTDTSEIMFTGFIHNKHIYVRPSYFVNYKLKPNYPDSILYDSIVRNILTHGGKRVKFESPAGYYVDIKRSQYGKGTFILNEILVYHFEKGCLIDEPKIYDLYSISSNNWLEFSSETDKYYHLCWQLENQKSIAKYGTKHNKHEFKPAYGGFEYFLFNEYFELVAHGINSYYTGRSYCKNTPKFD